MKQTVLELVDVILEKINEQPETPPSETGLRSWLAGQGYAKRDIDAALRLLNRRIRRAAPPTAGPQRAAFRHFSEYESYKMTRESRDALLRLERYGLITPAEREMVLERLDHFDGPVGLDELDYLLQWVVYSTRDVEYQHTLIDVMEGKKTSHH